jgi:hypothetical protein
MTATPRTIPDTAWEHVGGAVFRDGRLYPDTSEWNADQTGLVYPGSADVKSIEALSHFTLENYVEWAGATVLCPRAPVLEQMYFRFDNAAAFIAHGYTNPYREPGVPDWYFFWTKFYSRSKMRTFAREQGLLPATDLPVGRGGFGIDTGLRTHH